MTKENAVEQIYLEVTGGSASNDINIERPDIENYFSSSLATAIEMEFNRRYIESLRVDNMTYIIDEDFLSTAVLPVEDDENCGSIADLPFKVLSLQGENGVRTVLSTDSDYQFVKVKSTEKFGLDALPVGFHWLGKSTSGADRLFLKNRPASVSQVRVEYVRHPESYAMEDEIHCPATCLSAAIDGSTQYFLRMRQLPADEVLDIVDDSQRRA